MIFFARQLAIGSEQVHFKGPSVGTGPLRFKLQAVAKFRALLQEFGPGLLV